MKFCLLHVLKWAGLFFNFVLCSAVHAAEVTLSAEYSGEASGLFRSTTPPASFCHRRPGYCEANRLSTVALPIEFDKAAYFSPAAVEDKMYAKLPSPRSVIVRHEVSGQEFELYFEVQYLGLRAGGVSENYNPLHAYGSLSGGCSVVDWTANGPGWMSTLWKVRNPSSPTACHSRSYTAPPDGKVDVHVDELAFIYGLKMPSPLKMASGRYTGALEYTVGRGGDLDFGNNVTGFIDNSLRINFDLRVTHALVINFPAGSDHAVLEPRGGWEGLEGGALVAVPLERDMRFRLWSTGGVRIYKECEYDAVGRCGIRNASADEAPVRVGITLPSGIEHGGRPVTNLAIPTGAANALTFTQTAPELNQDGFLHFKVEKEDVKSMLAFPGTSYRGWVRVLFDAEF